MRRPIRPRDSALVANATYSSASSSLGVPATIPSCPTSSSCPSQTITNG